MLRVCRSRLQSLTIQNNRKKLRASLSSVDVSSPLNCVLDTESPGQIVRETVFTLFPAEGLSSLMGKLASRDRILDIVANLVHRAVDVMEEQDSELREGKRKEFQTAIFTYFVKSMQSGDPDYRIFAIYNRVTFEQVAPKLHADKHNLIERLIAQSILRAILLNRAIVLDPNRVLERTGVDGFRRVKDMYRLDLSFLQGKSLDRILESMRNKAKHVIHFELLDVWASVWVEGTSIDAPLARGSKWSLNRILKEIIRKRSKDMLLKLLCTVDENTRNDLIEVCVSKHGFTGMLRYPWAHDIIDEWRVETALGDDSFNVSSMLVPERVQVISAKTQDAATNPDEGSGRQICSAENSFLVDSDRKLTECKRRILGNGNHIGISFVSESVISISTENESFILDLLSVNSVFVIYLLKCILNDKSSTKLVYSLESFLNNLQNLSGKEEPIHFENLVDLRRSRSRKSIFDKSPSESLDAVLPGIIEKSEPSNSSSSQIESSVYYGGNQRMSEMVSEYLDVAHDRGIAFQSELWLYRPLSEELQIFAANDSHLLIRLEKHLRWRNIMPNEVLCYDPFS